jgi:phosphoserine phosphatase RsbU/P
VRNIDVRQSLRVAILMEMLEEVSRAGDPQQAVLAFGSKIRKLRPMDLFLSVSVRGLPKGSYKITRRFEAEGEGDASPGTGPWREWDAIPTCSGGFLGEIVNSPEPVLMHELRVTGDAVLGDEIAAMGSCLAVPIFDGGQVRSWNVGFRRDPEGFTAVDLEENLLSGNLFGAMTRNLLSIREIRSLNDKLARQFEEVAEIQRRLLPERLPEVRGATLAASYLTSEQAGGDYYDFFETGGGRVGVLVADVAGHGPAAATVMAMLHAILHCAPGLGTLEPAALLTYASNRLSASRMDGTFVTAVFAVFDPRTRELAYASAGHPAPRIVSKDGRVAAASEGTAGPPMGISPEFSCRTGVSKLRPGDAVVLFTDGVSEAFDAGGKREMFGLSGLDAALTAAAAKGGGAGLDADELVDAVHRAVYAHTGRLSRDDDQTVVVLAVDAEEHGS